MDAGDHIPQGDDTPTFVEQARKHGWPAQFFHFGKAEDESVSYFNPGLVRRPDGLWLVTRRSVDTPGMIYGRNDICAFKLDEKTRNPAFGKPLLFLDSKPDEQFEDPRVCRWGGQTWVSAVNFTWHGDGSWTGAHICLGYFRDDEDWTPIARRDPTVGTNLGHAGHTEGRHNKNLLWFFHDEKLHLIYESDPWHLVEFGSSWEEQITYRGEGVRWKYGHVRGGTPPVKVERRNEKGETESLFWTFFHSSMPWIGRFRRYYMGAMAFEAKPPFKPVYVTPEPLLIGSQNDYWRQEKPLVIFPCGALYENEKWLVSFGVNDLKSGWVEIPHADLVELAKPKPPAAALVLLGTPTAKVEMNIDLIPPKYRDLIVELSADTVAENISPAVARAAHARAALAEKRAKGLVKTKKRRSKRKRVKVAAVEV